MEAESAGTIVVPHSFVTFARVFGLLIFVPLLAIFAGLGTALVLFLGYHFSGGELEPVSSLVAGAFVFLLFFVPSAILAAIEAFNYRKNYRFSLQEEYVFAREGTVGPAYLTIPYENIQDVLLSEGPFEKLTGTATLTISTPASATTVPMVSLKEAEALKMQILGLAEKHRGLTE